MAKRKNAPMILPSPEDVRAAVVRRANGKSTRFRFTDNSILFLERLSVERVQVRTLRSPRFDKNTTTTTCQGGENDLKKNKQNTKHKNQRTDLDEVVFVDVDGIN